MKANAAVPSTPISETMEEIAKKIVELFHPERLYHDNASAGSHG